MHLHLCTSIDFNLRWFIQHHKQVTSQTNGISLEMKILINCLNLSKICSYIQGISCCVCVFKVCTYGFSAELLFSFPLQVYRLFSRILKVKYISIWLQATSWPAARVPWYLFFILAVWYWYTCSWMCVEFIWPEFRCQCDKDLYIVVSDEPSLA